MSKIGNPILDNTRLLLKRASKQSGARIWLKASKTLSKSISGKPNVNVGKIDKLTKKDAIVLIPGKVLGGGSVSHSIIVGAYSFTKSATIKIQNAGGKALLIPEFLENYSSKKGVTLIGG
jgi:large subunit ribosomal protein L18e